MSYYANACKVVVDWVESNPDKLKVFQENFPPYPEDDNSVQGYLNEFAHIQDLPRRLLVDLDAPQEIFDKLKDC